MGSRDFGDETGTLSFSTSFPIYEYTQEGAEGVEVISVVLSTVSIGLSIYLAHIFGENNNARPKGGDYNSILEDYVSAEMTGQNQAQRDKTTQQQQQDNTDEAEYYETTAEETCAERYASCPVSVFKAFQRYSTVSDKPKPTTTNLLGPNK
ncbi:hypothetical protein Pmani_017673 [Petrolisthes manimaculis]|uniref:Uncharacterized protein n=1 Tax=Petrolisthes manimaculis TaxID=1843537 RepID=A0AAE1U5J7_9EUCA|nr:hypothetical protein Pmani_017673 [Petrolisthes manimaculis]